MHQIRYCVTCLDACGVTVSVIQHYNTSFGHVELLRLTSESTMSDNLIFDFLTGSLPSCYEYFRAFRSVSFSRILDKSR